MEAYKTTIANNLIAGNFSLNSSQNAEMSKISEAVNYAWNNWDDSVLRTFYAGVKPKSPTEDFVLQWVENNDFEADGYDVQHLKEIFS